VNLGSGKGVNLATLAERIAKYAGTGSTVQITEERAPEVGRFAADVSVARTLFELECPEDPLEHLPVVVDSIRSEMLIRQAASESSNQ
jgi:UDP-glucose 4-epimerase